MHSRRFVSHAFWPVARAIAIWAVAADVASAASRAARWARICSARALLDVSPFVPDDEISAMNSPNWDDLSVTIISSTSDSVDVSVAVSMGVGVAGASDSTGVSVAGADVSDMSAVIVGTRDVVDGRLLRDTTAASATPMQNAKSIE